MSDKKNSGTKSVIGMDSLPPASSGSKMPQIKPAKPSTPPPATVKK